jgi:predicted HTH domain antitoxin
MKTMTLSVRLDVAEVRQLDAAAAQDGLDRSSILKRLVRRGYADYRLETACAAYRRQEVSLSRAAELAGIGAYDFLARFPAVGLQLNLTPDDLRQELGA